MNITDTDLTKVRNLSEEQARAVKNDVALSLHSWVRDITYSRMQSRRRAVLSMLESVITAAIGNDYSHTNKRRSSSESANRSNLH
jgi:hypothetical protein